MTRLLLVGFFAGLLALPQLAGQEVKKEEPKKEEPKKEEPKKPAKKPAPTFVDTALAGPDFLVQGEYVGTLDGKEKLAAQVVAKGNEQFDVYFLPGGLPGAGWDGKTKIKAGTDPKKTSSLSGGLVEFAGSGWTGTAKLDKTPILEGKTDKDQPFALTRVVRTSPTEGAKPPEGAIILFDGTNADEWNNGKLVEEKLLNMGVNSKKKFTDLKLHLEFRTPFMPASTGQSRGNSGVYLQGKHEVQVLDSFGLAGKNNECGGLYGNREPAVNMCLPPLSWQTYDIDYQAGTFDDAGKPLSPATLTVLHNGVKIHDNVALKGTASNQPGSINLQNHGNPVSYRNIWVVVPKK